MAWDWITALKWWQQLAHCPATAVFWWDNSSWGSGICLHYQEEENNLILGQSVPVKVSVQGLIPANLLDVPKSDIFRTPL